MPKPLAESVALITGGGTGIGAATARALAASGATAVVAGRRKEPLERVAAEIASAGGRARVEPFDLAREDPAELVRRTVEGAGRLDLLVSNAARYDRGSPEDHGAAAFDAMFALNVRAAYLLSRAAALAMRAAGRGGAIVHVSSTLGLRPVPMTAIYAATKAALNSFTQSLALEFAADRVRVNAVCPGVVDTPMHGDAFGDDRAAYRAHLEAMGRLHPLGRVGTAEEVAAMVAFLCSPAAAWTTGGLYTVDGGISLT